MNNVVDIDDFRNMNRTMPMKEMHAVYKDLLAGIGGDPKAEEYYSEVLEAAHLCSNVRKKCDDSGAERLYTESEKSRIIDNMAVKLNQLATYIKCCGQEALWIDKLGFYKRSTGNKKRVYDFACYVDFINSSNYGY